MGTWLGTGARVEYRVQGSCMGRVQGSAQDIGSLGWGQRKGVRLWTGASGRVGDRKQGLGTGPRVDQGIGPRQGRGQGDRGKVG